MIFDRQEEQLPTAMWQLANLFFFFWKAKGDSSDVDDEAKGFRGTRGQRKERDIIHPLLNLSQRVEESDQKLNVVLILCAFACVCVCRHARILCM